MSASLFGDSCVRGEGSWEEPRDQGNPLLFPTCGNFLFWLLYLFFFFLIKVFIFLLKKPLCKNQILILNEIISKNYEDQFDNHS